MSIAFLDLKLTNIEGIRTGKLRVKIEGDFEDLRKLPPKKLDATFENQPW